MIYELGTLKFLLLKPTRKFICPFCLLNAVKERPGNMWIE